MITTVLEARVEPDRQEGLRAGYRRATEPLAPAVLGTVLLQGRSDPTLWRIATSWSSPEALRAYRASVETPAGVALFRGAGAEPTLLVFDVVARAANAAPVAFAEGGASTWSR